MITYEEIQPSSPEITPYVHLYSFSQGTLQESHAKLITRAFPTFLVQFYFEFEGGLAELETQSSRRTVGRKGYINTCQEDWMDIYQTHSKAQKRQVKNFKIDLYPHVLFEVFSLSPLEIDFMSGELKEVWGAGYDALFDALEKSSNALASVQIFEAHFKAKIKNRRSRITFQAHPFLQSQTSLKALSAELGYSNRWIQKRHLEVFGVSFKKAQGMMRFFQTLHCIALHVTQGKTPLNLTGVAYENGYFDQAHFIKEFKRYAGMTPSAYVTKKFNGDILFYW